MDDRIVEAIQKIQAAHAVSQQTLIKYIAAEDGLTEGEVKDEVILGIVKAMTANKIKRTTQGTPQGTQGSFVVGAGLPKARPPPRYEVSEATSSSSSSGSSVVVDLRRPRD